MIGSLENVDWSQIPEPIDEGGGDHLEGMKLPDLNLASTMGGFVNLSKLEGRAVVYIYPMTGRPDQELPKGWDQIPGARGCTPQTCAFRDNAKELNDLGISEIFGLSVQDTEYQTEAAERLHLPFGLLSDKDLKLADALNLPTLTVEGVTLLQRMSLVIEKGRIEHVAYPVFPPDKNVEIVLEYQRKL